MERFTGAGFPASTAGTLDLKGSGDVIRVQEVRSLRFGASNVVSGFFVARAKAAIGKFAHKMKSEMMVLGGSGGLRN